MSLGDYSGAFDEQKRRARLQRAERRRLVELTHTVHASMELLVAEFIQKMFAAGNPGGEKMSTGIPSSAGVFVVGTKVGEVCGAAP